MEGTDPSSPVFARSEIDVLASPKQTWAALADIEQWPTWNPAVRGAELDGDLEVATSFTWAAGPGTNHCVLRGVDAPRTLAWSGRSMGVRHWQSWSIEPLPDGCRVITERDHRGLMARLFRGRIRKRAQDDLNAWVELLKLEAETRAADDLDEVGEPTVAAAPEAAPPPEGSAS